MHTCILYACTALFDDEYSYTLTEEIDQYERENVITRPAVRMATRMYGVVRITYQLTLGYGI